MLSPSNYQQLLSNIQKIIQFSEIKLSSPVVLLAKRIALNHNGGYFKSQTASYISCTKVCLYALKTVKCKSFCAHSVCIYTSSNFSCKLGNCPTTNLYRDFAQRQNVIASLTAVRHFVDIGTICF